MPAAEAGPRRSRRRCAPFPGTVLPVVGLGSRMSARWCDPGGFERNALSCLLPKRAGIHLGSKLRAACYRRDAHVGDKTSCGDGGACVADGREYPINSSSTRDRVDTVPGETRSSAETTCRSRGMQAVDWLRPFAAWARSASNPESTLSAASTSLSRSTVPSVCGMNRAVWAMRNTSSHPSWTFRGTGQQPCASADPAGMPACSRHPCPWQSAVLQGDVISHDHQHPPVLVQAS